MSFQHIPTATPSLHSLGNTTSEESTILLSQIRHRVPHLRLTPPVGCRTAVHHSPPPITFNYLYACTQGVLASDMVDMSSFNTLNGDEDRVLAELDPSVMDLRIWIIWPGYMPYEFTFRINGCGWQAALTTLSLWETRAGLAKHISFALKDFFESNALFEVHTRWRIGASHIAFENCVLLELRHVYDNIWQVELAVDMPLQY